MIISLSQGMVSLSPLVLGVDSDLNGGSPQFTLTCISTGGPATTVTWARDSRSITEGTQSVVVNTTTAEYVHTLTVRGRERGLYTCTVGNMKPSSATAELMIQGTYTQWNLSNPDTNIGQNKVSLL